jgi:hypothetical protein
MGLGIALAIDVLAGFYFTLMLTLMVPTVVALAYALSRIVWPVSERQATPVP